MSGAYGPCGRQRSPPWPSRPRWLDGDAGLLRGVADELGDPLLDPFISIQAGGVAAVGQIPRTGITGSATRAWTLSSTLIARNHDFSVYRTKTIGSFFRPVTFHGKARACDFDNVGGEGVSPLQHENLKRLIEPPQLRELSEAGVFVVSILPHQIAECINDRLMPGHPLLGDPIRDHPKRSRKRFAEDVLVVLEQVVIGIRHRVLTALDSDFCDPWGDRQGDGDLTVSTLMPVLADDDANLVWQSAL